MWPTRSSVPGAVWKALFKQTTSDIDVLVYSGGFLVDAYDLVEVIRSKARRCPIPHPARRRPMRGRASAWEGGGPAHPS